MLALPVRPLLFVFLAACGGAQHGGGTEGSLAWRYEFTLSHDLDRLDATVCFDAPYPASLVPADPDAPSFLVSPRSTDRIRIDDADGCARYTVDLEGATNPARGAWLATRSGRDLVAPTGLWLWGPDHRRDGFHATARFQLPPGVQVSVPWPKSGEAYVVNEHAYRFIAYAAFGRFDLDRVEVPGAVLEVARLEKDDGRPDPAVVRDWLTAQGTAASQLFGRLAVPRVQMIVVPVGPSDPASPAPFGTAARGGGPSVLVLFADNAQPARLRNDWVAVHELTHLEMPYIRREDCWLSEGLATYYQEVLRVRAGLQSSEDAWRTLDDGFRRGSRGGTGRSLAEEARVLRQTAAFERVYWGGAAYALFADVAIRAKTGNRKSLDDALRGLDLDRPRIWPARDVLAAMDEAAGEPLFTEIAEDQLRNVEFPSLDDVYRRLGIVRDQSGIRLTDQAPDRAIRDAITARVRD
jgi:hypothetical protein